MDIVQQLSFFQVVFYLTSPAATPTDPEHPTYIPRGTGFERTELHHGSGPVGHTDGKGRMFCLNGRRLLDPTSRRIMYQWGVSSQSQDSRMRMLHGKLVRTRMKAGRISFNAIPAVDLLPTLPSP